MFENIKIFTSDKYWHQILTDLGASVTDSQNIADVNLDAVHTDSPISIHDLQKIIFDSLNNNDIIISVFNKYIVLPSLQHKIIVLLYKNPNINMRQIKKMLGILPDVTSHVAENAIYQLRKKYGHDFILNENGKYKIGHL